MNATALYRALLRLYPRDYRALFALEMLAVFDQAARDRRSLGSISFLRFVLTELIDLIIGSATEWTAKAAYGVYHSNSYINNRCAPDPRLMWPRGIKRARSVVCPTQTVEHSDLTDEAGICLNAHQRFMFGSPLRRLLIFACSLFLPMHPRKGTKTPFWNC